MPGAELLGNAEFTTEIQSDGSKQFLLSVSHRQEYKGRLNSQADRENREVSIDRERGRDRQGGGDRSGKAESYKTDSYSVSGLNSNKRKMMMHLVESKLARERNVGWRLDYFFVSQKLKEQISNAKIHNDIHGSDHCPVSLKLSTT
jgi:endonuclease/exonuclease/phosphatase family metal-dependent hydrolase